MAIAARCGVDATMFYGYQDEWQWIVKYYTKYGKAPTKLVFRRQFPGFIVRPVNDTAHLAEQVKQAHAYRQLVTHAKTISRSLSDGDIEGAVAYAYSSVLNIASAIGVYNDGDIFRDNDDIIEELEATVRRTEETGSAGIPLGFPTFDERTGGAKPGELITVGARLGKGKSWVLTQWATNAARLGYTVQYNSLEMPRSQVSYRVWSLLANEGEALFRNTDLMRGTAYNKRAFKVFLSRLQEKIKGNLHVSDRSRGKVTPMTITAQIERVKPKLVVVDYVQLMGSTTGGQKDWASIGETTGELKGIAMQYHIPIVVASLLNRERGITRKGEPAGPEAISQSDAIGQDSDTVITLSDLSESVLAMKCAKNRHGASNFKWYVQFEPGEGIMREVSYDKALALADRDAERAEASGPQTDD
jgi:replicative DNA helicase